MKMFVYVALVVSSFIGVGSAHAFHCEAVKQEKGGKTLRGIRITIPGSRYSESVYFGTDSKLRDQAGRACWEVEGGTACSGVTPKASDRYMDVGDPGFGPRLWVEKSTRAGILDLQWVPADVQKHYPSNYSKLDGKYYAFFDGCEEARADLALEVVENIRDAAARAARAAYEKAHPDSDDNFWRVVP